MDSAHLPPPRRSKGADLVERARLGAALLVAASIAALGGCVTTADHEACARSCECKTLGRCSATRKGCAPASDAHCRASRACSTMGRCAYEDGACVAKTDDDCAASELCKSAKLCRPADGRCVM